MPHKTEEAEPRARKPIDGETVIVVAACLVVIGAMLMGLISLIRLFV